MATTSLISEGLSLLNLENKTRQQPKIAHEQGAGSQCSVCGPKCSGFDLHYWRKICRNCRCGKENHLVTDEDEDLTSRVGRLLKSDDSSSPPPPPPQATASGASRNKRPDQLQVHPAVLAQVDGPASPLDWVPPTADSYLAVKYIEQLPVAQQPITGSQAAFDRKRALDRQLPSHDLEPDRCKSLTASEKRKMEEYVKNVKRHVVGQGLIQECPGPRTSGKLPPPPPQLDRILEQKVNHLSSQGNATNGNGGLLTVMAKPATVRPSSTGSVPNFIAPKPFVKVPIKEEETEIDPMDLPPPPPDMLAGLEGDNKQPDKESIRKPDPVKDFFDFLDEQEGKKLPGRLKSPFLQRPAEAGPTGKTFNASARPFTPSPNSSPNLNQKRSSGVPLDHQIAAAAAAAAQRNSSPKTMNLNFTTALPASSANLKQQQRPLLTTDFDALPEVTYNNNNHQNSDSSRYTPSTAPLLNPINDNNNRQQQQEPRQPSPPVQQEHLQPPLHPHYEQEVIQGEDQVWICRKCVKPIEAGQVAIFAERAGSDKCWHPQCFTCSICQEMLADLIYFFVDESIFCGRHYAEKMNIPRCKACDELIFAPEYTSAEDASWHTNHFCCWICDTPLAGHKYTPVEGQPHCLDCYQKKYGKDCYECGKSIRADEMRVSHGEMNWHNRADCFRCACCKQSMIGRQFILKNQQIFCSRECVLSSSSIIKN